MILLNTLPGPWWAVSFCKTSLTLLQQSFRIFSLCCRILVFSAPCSQDFFLNAFFLFTSRYRWASRRFSQSCLTHANSSRCYLRCIGPLLYNVGLTITPKLSTILPPTCLTSFCGCPNFTPTPFYTSKSLHSPYTASLLLASPRILYLLTSASSLRETPPLAYNTFDCLIFIHKMVIWRRCLTICKSSVEDTC